MNWSTREHGSWQEGWSPTWPWSPLVGDPVRARHSPFAPVERFKRRKLFLGKYILEICQDHDVKGTSFVLPDTQRHAEFEVTSRDCSGMPRMIIPGFTLQHVVRFHKSTGDRPLVHAFQLPLHFQRHGVSSSPMETMFTSTPSKLPRSTSRTSHPSRLSPEVVLHVEHSQQRLC